VYLVQALFALNRRWQPWRSREMSYLLRLPWLPDGFAEDVLVLLNAPAHDYSGYQLRGATLAGYFQAVMDKLVQDKCYTGDPVSEAFIRRHDEPGRDWNIVEWVRLHQQR
jgi:hypothetical protein